jgi:alpha-beta hydrolase superfamily lysophospholipase
MTSRARKLLLRTIKLVLLVYLLICTGLYFFQERLIFFPEKLAKDYRFSFSQQCNELSISTRAGTRLSGLLFSSSEKKGLVFFLHGNGGSLARWGGVAGRYTALGYDVFVLDYPGYGKSEGRIRSQEQLYSAIQDAYDSLKKNYAEKDIIVMGYSIGTGLAANLASTNHPRMLVLHAPYFSMSDMMHHYYPVIPTFLLRYDFATNE